MGSDASRRRALPLLTLLFSLAVGCAIGGLVTVSNSAASGAPYEIGKWLLQLATVFTGAGFLSALLRQVEVTRAKREAWTTMLQDLVVGQDAVEAAFLRLVSDTNADTYTELIEKCRESRASLRRIMALPEASEYSSDLRRHLQRMRLYLKPLVQEYEENFLSVARQGKLDEKLLDTELDTLVESGRRTLPAELLRQTGVAALLGDAQRFPSLAARLQDFDPGDSQFTEDSELDDAYESVKLILRRNAGISRRG